MKFIFSILCFICLFVSCTHSLDFEISSVNSPVSGKEIISLITLQNNVELMNSFISQYNSNGGFPIEFVSISYCCILAKEGAIFSTAYQGENFLFPYLISNGNYDCESYINADVVQISVGYTGDYYASLNSSSIKNWQTDATQSCSSSNSYAFYGPITSSTTYSPSISPSATISPSVAISSTNTYHFEIGTVNDPVPGKQIVSLNSLQNNTKYANDFINQYNRDGGFPIEYAHESYCCILVQEGALYHYTGSTPTPYDFLYPYQNGYVACESYISGIVQINIGYDHDYYSTLNSSAIASWRYDTTQSCSSSNSYVLFGPFESNSSPSYTQSPIHTPSPTRTSQTPTRTVSRFVAPTSTPFKGEYVCCLYFSAQEQYESAFCQLNTYLCPAIPSFTPVGNYTTNSCDSCSINGY